MPLSVSKNDVITFLVAIEPVLFKLAGNEDMNKILDQFEFQPFVTTNYGVSCSYTIYLHCS